MNEKINVIITGDTHLGGGRVKKHAVNNQPMELFGDFLKRIKQSDIAITNLESPIIDKGIPITKTGPNNKSPVSSLQVLKNAGFDLVTLANNHIMDYGHEGLISTFNNCVFNGIATVGAGKNYEEASRPFIYKKGGINIAFINVAENEFGTTSGNLPGAHSLNPVKNYYEINKMREIVDHLVVIVHGGHENFELPSPRMKETYRFFIDAGADIVVGHHTHCFSGYELYNGKLIAYSLGNFLFDKKERRNSSWSKGLMLEIFFSKMAFEFKIHPFIQNSQKLGLHTMSQSELVEFNNTMERLNSIIKNDDELKKRFAKFCENSNHLYNSYLEPHSSRILHALRKRKLFPFLLSKKKRNLLLNLTRCEAHRDVILKILSYENCNTS